MVFKILNGGGSFHGMDYNAKKVKQAIASVLHVANFGQYQAMGNGIITLEDAKTYLENWSNRNTKVKKPQFHAILSTKGTTLTIKELKDHAVTLMDQMGYSETPLIIFGHHDTQNNHVHIVTTRVGLDGKKIKHDNEFRRAQKILNQLNGLDISEGFKKDKATVLKYVCSTEKQYWLLFELKGYTLREDKKRDVLLVFKSGTAVGEVQKESLKIMQTEALNSAALQRINQIKALLYKYGQTESTAFYSKKGLTYSDAKPNFKTDLSEKLQQIAGLEFVFFTGKDKTKPYGYTIVDHKYGLVYKGSDVMTLGQFEKLNDGTSFAIRKEIAYSEKEQNQASTSGTTLGSGIDLTLLTKALDELGAKMSQDSGQASEPPKRKWKNNFF